jgi:succinate dehydrogenase/fumarate reductase flavoprotein subunit
MYRYAADRGGLLQQHVPSIAHLPTTNGPFAQGEGVKLATAIGAQVTDMDKVILSDGTHVEVHVVQVQVHPTGFVDPSDPLNPTKILAAEALRGCGGILVNSSGQRFVNELGLRNEITRSIFDNCQKLKISDGAEGPVVAYMLLNEESVKRFHEGAFGFYTG